MNRATSGGSSFFLLIFPVQKAVKAVLSLAENVLESFYFPPIPIPLYLHEHPSLPCSTSVFILIIQAKAGAKADRGGSATAAAAKQDVLAAHTAAAAAPSYNNMAAEIGLHTPMLGIPPTSYTFEFMLLLFLVVHVIIQNFNLNGYVRILRQHSYCGLHFLSFARK